MKASRIALVLAAGLVVGGSGVAMAQDALGIIAKRQAVMKEQGKALGAIKALLDGKGDQAAAQAGADDLLKTIPQIPSVFPQQTSSAEFPGKTRAKPAIWAEWDKFNAAQQNALAKAQALDAAVKSGNPQAIQAAFADMGKNGCGGCHDPFREPPPKQ